MNDLSKPWPLGIGTARWWLPVLALLLLEAVALLLDHQISLWAVALPAYIRDPLTQITPYGESAWILWPSGVLFVVTAGIALLMRWKLMRTLLWQFTALYAFIFIGVGLPSLISTITKRLVGRGRPQHFDETGLWGFKWNVTDWTYQSFPSGHATTAFALAAVVGFVSPRWFYPGLALAAVIGFSRISEGVHYPSDVIAGAALGLLGAYFVRWLFARSGWLFDRGEDRITMRPMSSLRRYLALKKRGIAPKPQPDRS